MVEKYVKMDFSLADFTKKTKKMFSLRRRLNFIRKK